MGANINEVEYSWADMRVKIRGREIVGFKGIKYDDKITREKVYGARRWAIARTRGKVEIDDCSITMFESEFRALIAELGQGWGDVPFEIIVQYGNAGMPTHTDVLESCLLGGGGGGGEEGTSAFEREVPFSCMRIRRDGLYIASPV